MSKEEQVRGPLLQTHADSSSYGFFFFLPGLTEARVFRAFSMSRADQRRTLTPPTFCNGGASTVLVVTCRCRVKIVTPSFLAASRVERRSFIHRPISRFLRYSQSNTHRMACGD